MFRDEMDNCFIDTTIEFLSVAFHNILYYASIYPRSIFEKRKKYSVVIYRSMHPEVNQYIDLCLKSIMHCLKSGQLSRIEFSITDNTYTPVVKFVFDLDKNGQFDGSTDAYLVQTEENFRAFCLIMSSMSHRFNNLPEDCSFTIHLHTNESAAVTMATNPDLEDFPLVEVDEVEESTNKILPLRRFTLRNYSLDAYIEIR
ncbi:mitotic spindle assembly checkpoint protein MAD2B [Pectinophora gossypiella]|uniref:HORMA domain-containing protein n=1 Tax=Pectinophora gossypiella TaxID=13191 RepID=A0A1E1WIK7_PECGO|nr:mitotic spindle assembly checkpoint protein MAD2B [Pectinophora gossypiella]